MVARLLMGGHLSFSDILSDTVPEGIRSEHLTKFLSSKKTACTR